MPSFQVPMSHQGVASPCFPILTPGGKIPSQKQNRTLSVLQVINGEHFSGAERVQQILGQQLVNFGVETEFACLKPGKFAAHCGLNPDRIHAVPMKGRFDWQAISHLKELVTSKGYEILHAHTRVRHSSHPSLPNSSNFHGYIMFIHLRRETLLEG